MRSFIALATTAVLAGRVAADLQINVTGISGSLTASQFNMIQDSDLTSACSGPCGNATSIISACNGDSGCLCTVPTTSAVTSCQQCYFEEVIRKNEAAPAPNAGSTPALGAYVSACNATGTAGVKMALTLPTNWVGPTDIILNLPETIVTVGFGAFLGASAIFIFSSL